MITLYTAIGRYKVTENGLPTVTANGNDLGLTAHELLLWSSLAFRIMTYEELKTEFYEKERELHILGDLDFDHYLNRLLMRQLIASGTDCTGMDALYDLLGRLYLQAVPQKLSVRLLTFCRLWLGKGFPIRKAAIVLQKIPMEPLEKQLLGLLQEQMLSTAELIQCAEKETTHLKTNNELMDCLYADEETDCESIVIDSRFTQKMTPVLSAVANLYFKQQITFEIL